MTLREDPVFSVQARPDRKILGQLFKTYWLIEYEDQYLFIMDQHAAHEKVNYERLMKNFKEKEIYSQRLEPPMVVTVSMTEAEALTRYKRCIRRFRIYDRIFWRERILYPGSSSQSLWDRGKRLIYGTFRCGKSRKWYLGYRSDRIKDWRQWHVRCRSRGNQRVSLMEVEHLLDELMKLENPYQCPHGRPTIIKMSKYEIDKKFKENRIVETRQGGKTMTQIRNY